MEYVRVKPLHQLFLKKILVLFIEIICGVTTTDLNYWFSMHVQRTLHHNSMSIISGLIIGNFTSYFAYLKVSKEI